jgi:hypothetical protein
MERTVASAHTRIDALEKEVIAIKTEIRIQFKDLVRARQAAGDHPACSYWHDYGLAADCLVEDGLTVLAELAIANAAFGVIKETIANGGDIMAAGQHIFKFFDSKSEIAKKANAIRLRLRGVLCA